MFSISGAPLDEVWGTPKPQKSSLRKSRRVNSGPTKMYDDIIDAYIEDFQPAENVQKSSARQSRQVNILPDNNYYDVSPYFQEQNARNPPKKRCNEQVVPLSSSDFTQDALEYNNFFKGDNMFEQEKPFNFPTSVNVEQEQNDEYREPPPMMPTHLIQPIHQTYDNETSMQTQLLELGLYIMSGILLIFILEQILHLGLYLR